MMEHLIEWQVLWSWASVREGNFVLGLGATRKPSYLLYCTALFQSVLAHRRWIPRNLGAINVTVHWTPFPPIKLTLSSLLGLLQENVEQRVPVSSSVLSYMTVRSSVSVGPASASSSTATAVWVSETFLITDILTLEGLVWSPLQLRAQAHTPLHDPSLINSYETSQRLLTVRRTV